MRTYRMNSMTSRSNMPGKSFAAFLCVTFNSTVSPVPQSNPTLEISPTSLDSVFCSVPVSSVLAHLTRIEAQHASDGIVANAVYVPYTLEHPAIKMDGSATSQLLVHYVFVRTSRSTKTFVLLPHALRLKPAPASPDRSEAYKYQYP